VHQRREWNRFLHFRGITRNNKEGRDVEMIKRLKTEGAMGETDAAECSPKLEAT
jgi:hypothetical protein